MACVVVLGAKAARADDEPTDRALTLVREGVGLHDQGQYEDAVAKYRQALELEPKNALAFYELAFTYSALGDREKCIAAGEEGLRQDSEVEMHLFLVTANCYDEVGAAKKAARLYKRGLRRFPENGLLAFNYAVSLSRQGKNEKAIELVKQSIELSPGHASSHWLLGEIFEEEGYTVPALLAYLRFLSIEPSSERAGEAAQKVLALMTRGVTRESETDVTITIDPKPPKKEGDYSAAALILPLLEAGRGLGENEEEKTDIEHYVDSIVSFIKVLDESSASERRQSWVDRTYVMLFAAAEKAGVLEALAYSGLSSLNLPGTAEWLEAHSKEVDEMSQWLDHRR
jgi:tetratricopeptide (TPR) repeat protein